MKKYLLCACLVFLAPKVHAGLGNLATEHGLHPESVGSANAASLFLKGASASYYNPAGLTMGQKSSFEPGVVHVAPAFSRKSETYKEDLGTSAGYSVLSFKLDMAKGFGLSRRVNFGFNLAVADFGRKILSFSDSVAKDGQNLRYGKKPMFFNMGLGLAITENLSVGVGALATVDGEAQTDMHIETDGTTDEESFSISGDTRIFPLFSVLYMGDSFGVAVSYRSESYYHLSLNANNHLRVLQDGPLPIKVKTLDTYTPETYALGLLARFGAFEAYLTLESQRYSRYGYTASSLSTIQERAFVEYKDILVPRLGGRHQLWQDVAIWGGVSFEKSPLEQKTTDSLNYLIHDRWTYGLGTEYRYHRAGLHPILLGFAIQGQRLSEREIALSYKSLAGENQQEGSLISEGFATTVSFSLTSLL